MSNSINLDLEMVDVFQILDALNSRAESWERTEAVLNGEDDEDDFFVPEECHSATEAAEIAQHFRDIVAKIEAQLEAKA